MFSGMMVNFPSCSQNAANCVKPKKVLPLLRKFRKKKLLGVKNRKVRHLLLHFKHFKCEHTFMWEYTQFHKVVHQHTLLLLLLISLNSEDNK